MSVHVLLNLLIEFRKRDKKKIEPCRNVLEIALFVRKHQNVVIATREIL